MRQLFHRGMFFEGIRRLRAHGIIALILSTVFEAFPVIITLLTEKIDRTPAIIPLDFIDVHTVLLTIPFILPPILILSLMRFQTSRRDSDFYHSLPVTKVGISLSFLAAAAVWCAVVVIGSSLVMAALVAMVDVHMLSLTNVLLCVGGSLMAGLFVAVVTLFASTLSGSLVTTIAFTGMVIFGPRGALALLVSLALDNNDLVPYFDISAFFDSLLFGQYHSVVAWIVTPLSTALFLAAVVWLANRRPSETAGSSAVSPGIQTFMRILFAMGCSIPAIVTVYEEYVSYSLTFTLYLFVIVAYFLFEIITTKTVKNLVKTIPWLGVVAVLNVVCIFAMHSINDYVFSIHPTADQISSVSVTWLGECVDIEDDTVPYVLQNEYTNTFDIQEVNRARIFEEYRSDFISSDEYDKIYLTDESCKTAVSDALNFSIPYAQRDAYAPDAVDNTMYRLRVTIRTGSKSIERYVWVTQEQFNTLMTAIDKITAIPAHHRYANSNTDNTK